MEKKEYSTAVVVSTDAMHKQKKKIGAFWNVGLNFYSPVMCWLRWLDRYVAGSSACRFALHKLRLTHDVISLGMAMSCS